ncbi:hypothetical protein H4R99_006987 [Coemansia sp. RSA 1722]|nr:hypothetical protein H4R99_006987 [Coemansia sp. RSA 1722]
MAIVDSDNNIKHADSEAVSAFRGPAEGWHDDQLVSLRDGSCTGAIDDHWTAIERLCVGNSDQADDHHYLVVQRSEDAAVCWIQVCVHYLPTADNQHLYAWYVRDISSSARCLESFGITTKEEYTLSLEDDGFPFSALLTQSLPEDHGYEDSQQLVTHASPAEQKSRDQLARLLESAVLTETFAVLYLTGFGAIDSVFPRRLLGWGEPDLVERSFIGLLSPEDRTFFCRVLRRCSHDGIPQRLIVKMACAPGFTTNAGENVSGVSADGKSQKPEEVFVDCDVTVIVPESVQQPVLIVRATDQQRLQQACCADAAAATSLPSAMQQLLPERHSVRRTLLLQDDLPFVSTAAMIASPAHLTSNTESDRLCPGLHNNQLPLHMGGSCGKGNGANEEASTPLDRRFIQEQQQQQQNAQSLLTLQAKAALSLSSYPSIQPHSASRSEASSLLSADENALPSTPPITSLESAFLHSSLRPQSAEEETTKASVMGSHKDATTISLCSPAAAMASAQTISAPQPPPLSGLGRIAASQGLDTGTLCEKTPTPACGYSRSAGSQPADDWSRNNPTIYEKAWTPLLGTESASFSGKQASELRSGAQVNISMSDIFACLQEHPSSTKSLEPNKGPALLNGGFGRTKTLVIDGAFDSMLDRLNIGAIWHAPH